LAELFIDEIDLGEGAEADDEDEAKPGQFFKIGLLLISILSSASLLELSNFSLSKHFFELSLSISLSTLPGEGYFTKKTETKVNKYFSIIDYLIRVNI
jgi:hypothetical protein